MPRGRGSLPIGEDYVDIINIILNLFGFTFPTHRPDPDELPEGTQWFNGTPEAGVVHMWTQGGVPKWRWKGEILATKDTNYPVGAWDYDGQTFYPLIGLDPNGCCLFCNQETFEREVEDPNSHHANVAHNKGASDFLREWSDIGNHRSPIDQHKNKYIAEEIRSDNWEAMGDDASRFLIDAEKHNVPFYPPGHSEEGFLPDIFEGTEEEKTEKRKTALKIGGTVVGILGTIFTIWRTVKK